MTEKFRNPSTVIFVRFPSRDLLQVCRVDQQNREAGFEQIPNRLPINTCGFDCNVCYVLLAEPLPEHRNIFGRRAKLPDLLARPSHRHTRVSTQTASDCWWTSIPQQHEYITSICSS
jgi:hypothetical protein